MENASRHEITGVDDADQGLTDRAGAVGRLLAVRRPKLSRLPTDRLTRLMAIADAEIFI